MIGQSNDGLFVPRSVLRLDLAELVLDNGRLVKDNPYYRLA